MVQKWNSQQYNQDAGFVSELGKPIVDLLDPQPMEHILDLGCGDGTLALEIQPLSGHIIGVDFSESMVTSAKSKGIEAYQMDGEALTFTNQFDGVFSNAALHWMKDHNAVLSGVYRSLKNGGRFVAEFGGHGNIELIEKAMTQASREMPDIDLYQSPWYFPTEDAYRELLVSHGFEVKSIELFERPTPLSSGMRAWLEVFAKHTTKKMTEKQCEDYLDRVTEILRETLYDPQSGWVADYVRLRLHAVKSE